MIVKVKGVVIDTEEIVNVEIDEEMDDDIPYYAIRLRLWNGDIVTIGEEYTYDSAMTVAQQWGWK